ncbi:uncharacterized protein N0V89_011869 [Didymosphaeria variabile]|uniref:Wax synthase domain-containing protein n=1 Tax=Didymosphaeria variabile TaxID=1932322 RepID=A0A9W8XAR9_9PLEO|nr:uncharacterized protein N0V89_011869 [Didymosphaeria variabile]KAJ4345734.1 hypothetical protein N0V89_011869 [Didymosphaeria variabile]
MWPFTCLVVVSFPSYINRWMGVSMVLAAGLASWRTATNLSPDGTLNEMYVRYILIGGSHALAMAYKNPLTKEVPNALEPRYVKASWNPWYRGWKTVFNVRGIGTEWENPYLWPGIKHTWQAQKPSTKVKDPDTKLLTTRHNLTARGRWSGIAIRCAYLLLNFFLLAAYYEFMDAQKLLSVPPSMSDYTRDKEGVIRRLLQTYLTSSGPATPVTTREFQLRALEAFDKVVGDFLLISLYHDTCAVVWMAVGLDESWEWPPVYGRIREAYTMRRFWTMYWHRTFYKSSNSHAALISTHILGIKKRTIFTRVLNAFLVFGISGFMHSMVEARLGHPCAWGRNMWYWALQPVAFVLEGVVQFFWGKLRRRIEGPGDAWALNAFERLAGYSWVCAWLIWEAPKHSFPLITCS